MTQRQSYRRVIVFPTWSRTRRASPRRASSPRPDIGPAGANIADNSGDMIRGGWVNEGRGRSGRRPGGRFPAGLTGAPAPFRQYFMDHAVCLSLISEISPPFTPHNFLERGILLIKQRSIFSKGTKKTTGIKNNPNGKFVPSEFWQGRGQSHLARCHLRATHSTGVPIPAEERAVLVRRPEFCSGWAFKSAADDPAELQHRAAAMPPSALGLPPNPEGKRPTEQ